MWREGREPRGGQEESKLWRRSREERETREPSDPTKDSSNASVSPLWQMLQPGEEKCYKRREKNGTREGRKWYKRRVKVVQEKGESGTREG